MKKILFITSIFITFFTFSQEDIQSDEMGVRFLTQKIGNINERFFYETEKPTEEMKYTSKIKGEKVYLYKKRKGLSVFNEKGFLFHKQLDKLTDFPANYGVVESFIYLDKIYTLIYKKDDENIANLRIIELNSILEIVNNNLLSFDLSTNIEDIDLKSFENQVAIISKMGIEKNKSTIVETVGIDLLKNEIQKSHVSINVQNEVILSDFIINKDLIINAVFYSTNESNFKKLEKFTTVFVKFDELNSTISNYDYNSNKNFIPVSYKFTKINENEYYIGSIAIPIEGAKAGYFISKNSFDEKIDFNSSSVITATDFLKDENWSDKDKKLISKGKCPITYRHEKLTNFFISNGNINFISLKSFNLGSDNSGSSTMNASSASSVGGGTSVGMSSGGGAEPMEGNITFASFKLESYESHVFFKTLEKQSSDQSSTNNNFFYIIDEAKIDIYFTIGIFSDEFNFSKKETGISFLSESEILKLTYNFSEKTKKFNIIEPEKKSHCHILEYSFVLNNKLNFLKFEKALDAYHIEKIFVEQILFN